jgi:ligand-binding sensor domain-containing protein/putative methionine-R-sulfoxide reductase with GAF domain
LISNEEALRKIAVILVVVLGFGFKMQAQTPAFYHLSTAEGLSDNNAYDAVRDKNGIVWIATMEGLNSFDGNRITTYYKHQYPQMASNIIDQILVDNNNHIWLRGLTDELTMIDAQRRFHLYKVGDTSDRARVFNIFYLNSKGIVAVKGRQHYTIQDKTENVLRKLDMPGDSVLPAFTTYITKMSGDTMLYWGRNVFAAYDFTVMKPLFKLTLPGIHGIVKLNDDEVMAYTQSGSVFYCISLKEKKVVREIRNMKDASGKIFKGDLRVSTHIAENKIGITSRFDGLYIFDFNKLTYTNWKHDPLDARSLGGNNTYRIKYDSSGYLFVCSLTSGVNYVNLAQTPPSAKYYFIDKKQEVFDGFIQAITTDVNGNLWMGCQDRLTYWNKNQDKAAYVPLQRADGTIISTFETIRSVCFDSAQRLWIGSSTKGILIMNERRQVIHQLTDSSAGNQNELSSNWINTICRDSKGKMWLGTYRGVCIVDEITLKVTRLENHPLLSPLARPGCNRIWMDKKNRIWIGTVRGVWCYDEAKNMLQHYSTENGLISDMVYAINEDKLGNYYFGTSEGLSILSPKGVFTNYNRTNSLRNNRCEGILRDEQGFMWIGNLSCIFRFDPIKKTFILFEEGLGFNHSGFRMRSSHQSANGEMFWGTDKGLLYFFPQQLAQTVTSLRPSISGLQAGDSVMRFTRSESFSFAYNTVSFVFLYSSGELSGGKKSQLLYRLHGFDKDWKIPVTPGQAVYSKLPPGDYTFEIKASRDGANWVNGLYTVQLTVKAPWWQTVWLRLLVIAFAAAVMFFVVKYYQRRRQAKEVQKMIEYFANSGYEYSAVNDILWDICRNCISRLGFEDCVIYLVDDERNLLQQKAAYGPKNPKEFEILNPIEIPMGKGIVGDVAVTGKASVINDTSKDERYIVDDERRYSELTIPLVHEGKVIGVIDSEHRHKNFFTQEHLNALQSIASICSAKISRGMAMEAMKKNEKELMELSVKMAESKFLNLRLQMNPHFLFNSLSSIQHLIVSQQTTKAYKYLTIFSNFLRSLLNFAEKNFIPLDEELKILNMYVELESLRFDESFHYEIKVDDAIISEEVLVPSLMIQPFAENAIWHGLLHKEGEKLLMIHFKDSDDALLCVIEDNGIGREKAAAINKSKIASKVHESKGINIIKERLQLLQQKTGKPASIVFEDVQPSGTSVTITIPYYNPEVL